MPDARSASPGDEPGPLRVAVLSPAGVDEVGLGLAEGFAANGCDVALLTPDGRWPSGVNLYIIYGPMAPIGSLLVRLRDLAARPSVAVWYTEPLPPPLPTWALAGASDLRGMMDALARASSLLLGKQWVNPLAQKAGRVRACAEMRLLHRWGMLDLLAVFTQRHAQVFGAWGLPAEVIPMGACASFGRPLGLVRDIDVAFIGSTRDRRRGPLVAGLAQRLAAAGIKFVIKDGSPEHGYIFGEERTALLNRSKILLGIMRQPWDDPIFRMLLAAPNGVMLLSEPVCDSGPFVAGTHFGIARVEEMPDVLRYYLANEADRCRIAAAAQALVENNLTMAAMARCFFQAWARRTAQQTCI